MFVIRTHEANLRNAYEARRVILKEDGPTVEMPDDYAFMQELLRWEFRP